jgi:hypothetical protein
VRLDGLAGDAELLGDPAVGLALRDQREHLAIPRGELGERVAGDTPFAAAVLHQRQPC